MLITLFLKLDLFYVYELKVIFSRFVKNIVMKIRLLFIGLFFVTNLGAQVPSIQWEKRFGGTWFDSAYSIDITSDGGYILAGRTESNNGNVSGNHGLYDFWIVKLDALGILQWQRTLGGMLNDFAYSIKQTSEGGYIVVGESESIEGDVPGNHGGYDGMVVKLSSIGEIEWYRAVGFQNSDGLRSVVQAPNGHIIVAGSRFLGSSDFWIADVNTNGYHWYRTYGGSEADTANSIQLTTDGGFIVAGSTYSNNGNVTGNHGSSDFWILKLNSIGNFEWQKTLGGTNEDFAKSIQQTSDGGYIVSGYTFSNDGNVSSFKGVYDSWVVKLNSVGDLEWQKTLGGTNADAANDIIQTSDGGYIVIGDTVSNNTGDVTGFHNSLGSDYWDIWLVKLNSTGTIVWKKALGGAVQDIGNSIKRTNDGGFVIAGSTNSSDGDITGTTAGQGTDFWIVKFTPENLGISESEQKTSITLYPNPVKNELTVKLDFYMPSQKISISDVHGKTILTKDAEDLITTINTSTLSQGTYFLTVQNLGKKTTQKFIVE